jgi:hypothetical protein
LVESMGEATAAGRDVGEGKVRAGEADTGEMTVSSRKKSKRHRR